MTTPGPGVEHGGSPQVGTNLSWCSTKPGTTPSGLVDTVTQGKNFHLNLTHPTKLTFGYSDATGKVSISSEELAKEYRSEDDALVKTPYRHPGAGQNFYFV